MATSISAPSTASTGSTVGPAPVQVAPTPETTPQPVPNAPTGNPAPKFQVNPAQNQLRKLTGGIAR